MASQGRVPSLLEEEGLQKDQPAPNAAGRAGGTTSHSGSRRQLTKAVLALVILGFSGWLLFSRLFGGVNIEMATRTRVMIDKDTGEIVEGFVIPLDEPAPYTNPKTKARSLVPAEKCFWTRDGNAKLKPTYVLLNQYKGDSSSTTCPDCGRRVTLHNPLPPEDLMRRATEAAGK